METKNNAVPKENSWGDITIQASHKPGMTDIRPSTKASSRRGNMRDAHLKPHPSSMVIDQPTMQALKAKLAAAKQIKEQRYIHAHRHHEPLMPLTISEHTSSTHILNRRRSTSLRTIHSLKSTTYNDVTCDIHPFHERSHRRRRRFILEDIYILMRAFVLMNSASLRYSIVRELHRNEVIAKLQAAAQRLETLQMELQELSCNTIEIVDSESKIKAIQLSTCSESEALRCSTCSNFKLSWIFNSEPARNSSSLIISQTVNNEATADVNTINSKFSLIFDSRVSSTSINSKSIIKPSESIVGNVEIEVSDECMSLFSPPVDVAATLSLERKSSVYQKVIVNDLEAIDVEEVTADILKFTALLDKFTKPRRIESVSKVGSYQVVTGKESKETYWAFLRALPKQITPYHLNFESRHVRCLTPRFHADDLALLLHSISDTSLRPVALDVIATRRRHERGYHQPASKYHYPQPSACVLKPQTPHNRHHLTRIYNDYLALWRNTLAAIVTLFFRVNETQGTMWPSNERRKLANDAQVTNSWLSGGTFGSRSSVLVFRSSALAQASEVDLATKPGSKLHITFRVVQAETKLLAKLLECHGINEASADSTDYNILWTGSHPKPGILRSMAAHQRVNHFPRSYELTRKDRLYKNIERMQHAKGFKHFDFIPQTFLMPTEYRELCSTHHRVKGPWIVKPAASSRGRGIYIVESPNQVPIEEPVVVAKYISKPLLIKGHKCDLRLYVVVTSFDPMLIYIYEEGMVRFATVKYDTTHKQLWNPCMHLCNYSINKYHSDYVKSDDPSAENVGHKWTLSALLRHLKGLGKDTAALMSQVEDLVIKAILSCGNSIVTACKMFVPNPANCFELYGFDILIDEDLKPWLLEVNLSPSLGCDSPLDVRLKSAMLSDLLTLVGIPAVDPIVKPPSPSRTTSSKSLKMKISNCRRIHSADGLSNHTLPKKSSKGSISVSNSSLTAEDNKMIKNAKSQFARRGGFVRIFPAVDSWSKYSQYLDAISGIPIAGSSTSIPYSFIGQHNNNQILYKYLYPDASSQPLTGASRADKHLRISLDRKRDGSVESVRRSEGPVSTPRQDRYERKLSQGHRSTLSAPKKPIQEDYSAELKRQVCEMVKNGKKLSQVEARKAFSQYLMCVLKRISNSPDQNEHIEIVLKFLQKASSYLKNPFYVKIPSQKLSEKDRAAIVAKQLNDFLYLYNRETDLYVDLDRPSQIPRNVFHEFLEHSSEGDLEELLILQNIHTVPNSKEQPSATSFQGLLRCLPSINSICFSSPEATKKSVKVTPLS